MKRRWKWRDVPHGKKLVRLHAWNAWLVLLLAITGIALFIPGIRGDLGAARVMLKQAHIALGILSAVVLLLYVPSMRRHVRQLRGKTRQQRNLGLVLALLTGWTVSGIVLWQFRNLPPAWSNAALVAHDWLTWIGVPYAVFHAVTRSRWLREKRKDERFAGERQSGAAVGHLPPDNRGLADGGRLGERIRPAAAAMRDAVYTRRTFLIGAFAAVLAAIVGPKFYRWLFAGLTGPMTLDEPGADGNGMLPAPTPLPDSLKPLGGGAQGQFRVYTVTKFPSFSTDNWTFTLNGLVDKPLEFDWERFLQIPRRVQVSDFHCVTGWSVYKITWEGVPLRELLEQSGVRETAKFVKFYSGDGVYTDCLTLEQARMDDCMAAILMDGKPIPQKLGGPVRLVVPKMYAYKSVKWLQGIELIEKEHIGYWEERGYDTDAWVPGLKPGNLSGV